MSPQSNGPSKPPAAIAAAAILLALVALVESNDELTKSNKDISRKSIVFDIKTPKVFYCPQEKPADLNKMIVKAKPLDRLCQFGGKSKPKGSPSDCYNDVDETEFACDEKKRFMVSIGVVISLIDIPAAGGIELRPITNLINRCGSTCPARSLISPRESTISTLY